MNKRPTTGPGATPSAEGHAAEAIAAWRKARARHYADTHSAEALAGMIVELEDDHDVPPQFELDEEWPQAVRHLKIKTGGER